MSIKLFLILIYIVAGLIISLFTAFMTFYIIDVPIGMKMFSKIVLSIGITLPIIALLSYLIGRYFSKKFIRISERLHDISNEEFKLHARGDYVKELEDIHKTLNTVSNNLQHSLNTLKEKNSELSLMIRSFAHDFRTPLTIIEGNIEAIEDNLVKPDKLPEVMHKLKLETNYMNELLADVLVFIKSMQSVSNKENINLHAFINTDIIALLHEESAQRVQNHVDATCNIEFSKTDLKKVLHNLIDNSIKYADKSLMKIYTDNKTLIIEDRGKGIDSEEIDNIFKAFYTIEESKNRTQSGFGLGLAIVKNLVEKNGYEIYCDKYYVLGCKMIIKQKL